jgi:hypothetical protein
VVVGTVLVVILMLLAATVLVVGSRALVTWARLRGKRVVACPETREPVGVELDARRAAIASLLGEKEFSLSSCTRWPERAGCGQECLAQIEQAPHDCLVRSIVERWYENATCVFCGKAIGAIHWGGHNPALLTPDQKRMIQWHEVRPERLIDVLNTHHPVCWDCFVVEKVRRAHPEVVTDRPAH